LWYKIAGIFSHIHLTGASISTPCTCKLNYNIFASPITLVQPSLKKSNFFLFPTFYISPVCPYSIIVQNVFLNWQWILFCICMTILHLLIPWFSLIFGSLRRPCSASVSSHWYDLGDILELATQYIRSDLKSNIKLFHLKYIFFYYLKESIEKEQIINLRIFHLQKYHKIHICQTQGATQGMD